MRFNSTDKCVSDGPRERAVPLASFEFSRNVVCVVVVCAEALKKDETCKWSFIIMGGVRGLFV